MADELLHDLLKSAPGSATAIAEPGRSLSYAEISERSVALAQWLGDAGVREGDRVVFSLTRANFLFLPAFVFACSRVGAAFCAVHEQVIGEPLDHVLRDAGPALVVSDNPAVRAQADALSIRTCAHDEAVPAAGSGGHGRFSADLPACLIYTSGSTSRPKAVVSTHRQMVFVARAIQSMLNYRQDDVVFVALPMSFDVGLYQILLCALSGARMWLGTSGVRLVPELADSGATVFPAVPALAGALEWGVRRSRPGSWVPKLRLLTTTGAAMQESTVQALRKALPSLRVQLMYGLTECKRATIMPVDGDLTRPGSSGRALPGTEIRVLNERGEPERPGVIGEIVVTGPHVMSGYWNRPELTAQRFRHTGLHTGDYGYLDEAEYLYVQGRRDDVYKQNGFRVSALEVEAAAVLVPGVETAALLPPRDDVDSTLVVVGSVDVTDLRLHLPRHLEEFKLPRWYEVVDEMPLSHNNKVDKAALRLAVRRSR
jgi:acyl-CoA synthetase (AMP-forming)/AMP-acid ligase II